MKWRWNWFSFQRFHSLPQNFMLDCQCSEMHGLWRGLEMMCVTRHSKMWELEPHLSQGKPQSLHGCIWPGRRGRKPMSWVQVRMLSRSRIESNMNSSHGTINFLDQVSGGGFPTEPIFPEIYSEPLHMLGAKEGDMNLLGSLWSNWGEKNTGCHQRIWQGKGDVLQAEFGMCAAQSQARLWMCWPTGSQGVQGQVLDWPKGKDSLLP